MTDTLDKNVDPSEIQKFERMASRWWDPNGEFKPLHDMNPVRVNFIDAVSQLAEKTVLDVGCGGGILSEAMAQRGADVTGIDMGDAPLEIAKLHSLESGVTINYQKAIIEEFANEHPEHFDIVTCLELLEHVPDPGSVIRACADAAKPGASIFFSTINRNLKAYLIAVFGAEYVARLLPKGTHEYKKFIKPSELARWARQSGLIVKDVKGITYHPVFKSFQLSDSDTDVNYIVHVEKPA